jgi:hypothetical protein
VQLEEKIAKLKTQMKELPAIEIQLNESPDKQVSANGRRLFAPTRPECVFTHSGSYAVV